MRSVELFERGFTRAQVARELDVSHTSATRWFEAWERGGRQALAAASHPGPARRLDDAALARVEAELLKGALAHG